MTKDVPVLTSQRSATSSGYEVKDLRGVPVDELVHERRVEECDVQQRPDKRRAVKVTVAVDPLFRA